MPHFTLTDTSDGMELTVVIGLNGREAATLVQAGQSVPVGTALRGVLDSGSNVTCVAARAIARYGLLPVGQDTTQTMAGPFTVRLFRMSLSIPRPGPQGGTLLVLDDLMVMEFSPQPGEPEVMVGRNVLAHLLLIHDGPKGEFTLAD
jgi:hypothetical protein